MRKHSLINLMFLVLLFACNSMLCAAVTLETVEVILAEATERLVLSFDGEVPHFLKKDGNDLILIIDLLGCVYPEGEYTRIVNGNAVKLFRLSQVKQDPAMLRLTTVLKSSAGYSVEKVQGGLNVSFSVSGVPASASQGSFVPEIREPAEAAGAKLVNLSFTERPVQEIVAAVSREFGVSAVFEQAVDLALTVNLNAVTFRDCLREILDKNGISYRYEGGMLSITGVSAAPLFEGPVSFSFTAMNLREAFQTISMMTGLNVVVDNEVKERKVDLFINNMPLKQVMDLILTTYQLDGYRFNDSTFIVTEKNAGKKFAKNKIRRVFQLVNADPKDVVELLKGNKELSERLSMDSITIDSRIDALIVYDTPENVQILTDIIKGIDRKLRQVRIDVRLVEISKNDMEKLGVTIKNTPVAVQIMKLNLYKRVTDDLVALLETLAEKKRARILSSPIIRVIDGKSATINVGEVVPVPYYTYDGLQIVDVGTLTGSSSNQNVTNLRSNTNNQQYYRDRTVNVAGDQLQYVQPIKRYEELEVGIKLTVKPTIHEDREIELDINLDISSIINIGEDGQVHRSSKNTNTFVRVKDGETVVLGGLINQRENKDEISNPLLKKVPFLRKLFKTDSSTIIDSEMLMFLTPYLVNEDATGDPQLADYENLTYGQTW
ncbi:MAG: secretin N-terminal domain-containing protein [Candidatus Wallbacteria bacterium]|nr:secretin N-terminal domain-containing protein [Candidatus Wallbacteria bacterium]